MAEPQPGPVTAYRQHIWDFATWTASAEYSSPLRCAKCGFEARAGGMDVPADCSCDMRLEGTCFDFSDHGPGCQYFSGPSCPADIAEVLREMSEQERAFASLNRRNGHDRIAEIQDRTATQLEDRANELTL